MKHPLLLGMCVVGGLGIGSVLAADKPKEIVRDKSPDGKFALEISGEAGGWSAAIIDLKTKGAVVDLEIYQNYTDEARLVWSKDSQRVAYFEPDRRGGSTTVYFRKEPGFEAVELPEIPDCKMRPLKKGESVVKAIEETTQAQKWLSSGALVLRAHSDVLMEKGEKQYSQTCTQVVTVGFDSDHKASVQSAKQVKSD